MLYNWFLKVRNILDGFFAKNGLYSEITSNVSFGFDTGLPEPPIFEISGSGSSSRQIPAPAPTPTPPYP